jgi:hypothetical protein
MEFCKSIHESNQNEKYIQFLMTQKDIRSRNSFKIASDNGMYQILESPEIGTIVKKKWNGKISYDSFFSYSSLFRYLNASIITSFNPYDNFEKFDPKKVYIFQLDLWVESCSMRYFPESISTILLIVLYNYYIFKLLESGSIMNPLVNSELSILLYLYIGWTVAINLNIINIFIFSKLSKRKFSLNSWSYVEIVLMLLAFLLLVDTDLIFAKYDSAGNKLNEKTDFSFISKASILALNDMFVWFRLSGILLTFKEFGPSIRMIYLLCVTITKYLILFLLFFYCCVAIFTALFFRAAPQEFGSYSQSFVTLFKAFITDFDTFNFNYYKFFGAFMMLIFVTLSGVFLMNLLIALLDGIYSKFEKFVDASHTSILITYYRRYKWDNLNGFLLFLPTPLNLINFLLLPFTFLFKTTKGIFVKENDNEEESVKKSKKIKFNMMLCKMYFIVLYIPIILIMQFCGELIALPLCYVKGLVYIIRHQFEINTTVFIKFKNVCNWIFFGFFFLCKRAIHDKILVFLKIFSPVDISNIENNFLKNFIEPSDIKIFLEFIHTRSNQMSNDLPTIFRDYTKFDIMKKEEDDENLKAKATYLEKISKVDEKKQKRRGSTYHSTFFLFHNKNVKFKKVEKIENYQKNYNKMCKRNLLIIDIFENFLINDGSDNQIVDLDKLKNLLPKTTNLNNAYIKRLFYTNIKSLNTAINKLNNKTSNIIVRERMLNKIMYATEFLDKILDYTSFKSRFIDIYQNNQHDYEVDSFNELKVTLNKIYQQLKDRKSK